MHYKSASIIVSIYKNTSALRVILDSLKRQTFQNFEIIISEDADFQEVRDFVSKYKFTNPMQFLTQEDNGWRKNLALNRAILAAKHDWLIFIDGDCVVHPRFVEMHMNYAHPDVILAGKRVKLNDYHSQKLINDVNYITKLNSISLLQTLYIFPKGKCQYCEEGIFIKPNGIFGFIPKLRKMKMLKGCNMSFSKSAIMKINGFDMDYIRPAIGEDIDLTWRFRAAGYKIKSLRNLAVQYHLNHKENWHDQSENEQLMYSKQTYNQYICINGIDKIIKI